MREIEFPEWLIEPFCVIIEKSVTEYLNRVWKIQQVIDMSDYACHPCGILLDDTFSVFVKYGKEEKATIQFEDEVASLKYLYDHAKVQIPTPISIVPVECGTLFIMIGLQAVDRTSTQWKDIGKTLAHIHKIKSDKFGFYSNGFLGPVFQDNTPTDDWITFFREYRLFPFLNMSIESGHLPKTVVSQLEKVIQRLPELCDTNIVPS